MSLLELQYNQEITIKKVKYQILNMTKFREKSSYWIEYQIRRVDDYKIFYLSVEISSKVILYEILDNATVDLKMNIWFQGDEYELFESGNEKVESFYGITDVRMNDEATYYEYRNKRDKKIVLSVEKWNDGTEVSLGREYKPSDIKFKA